MTRSELKSVARSEAAPTFRQALAVWARIGVLSFGGPTAQIALMHRVVVEEQNWLSEKQFLNALSFCMLLPGPEAMQLATYSGWRMHGVAGGLAAGLLFVLPGAAIVLILASVYAILGEVPLVNALFLGVKAAVLIIVLEALLRVAKRALHLAEHRIIAVLAFVGLFFLTLPYPLIVAAAALFGFSRRGTVTTVDTAPATRRGSVAGTVTTILTWLAIWWVPLLLISLLDPGGILANLGFFFSKLAIVTFGGAYAVLAYMAQDVVNQFGWLSAGEMLDGLGLAETTPGPLILVTEFVGFLAGYRTGGFWIGLAGVIVTLWATFVPCFLWIFAGAPFIDWIGEQPRLKSALSAITAAVVGVILNLSIWFALHVLFAEVTARKFGPVTIWQPDLATLNWYALILSIACAVMLLRLRWGLFRVLAAASLAGAAVMLIS